MNTNLIESKIREGLSLACQSESLRSIARRSGLPFQTLWRFHNGVNSLNLDNLIRLAEAVGIVIVAVPLPKETT